MSIKSLAMIALEQHAVNTMPRLDPAWADFSSERVVPFHRTQRQPQTEHPQLHRQQPRRSSSRKANRKNKKKGSVRFRESATVRKVYGSEMTDDERRSVWYSEDDIEGIQAGVTATICAMRRNELPRDEDCGGGPGGVDGTVRGLEHMATSERMEARRLLKRAAIVAVLDEQAEQRLAGICNPHSLAVACCRETKRARDYAARMGAVDAARAESQNRPKWETFRRNDFHGFKSPSQERLFQAAQTRSFDPFSTADSSWRAPWKHAEWAAQGNMPSSQCGAENFRSIFVVRRLSIQGSTRGN